MQCSTTRVDCNVHLTDIIMLKFKTLELEQPGKASSTIEKFILVSLYAVCFIGFAYSLTKLAIYYMSEPQASVISTRFPLVMYLPQILVCTPTPLNITQLLQDNFTTEEIGDLYWHFTTDLYRSIGKPIHTSKNVTEKLMDVFENWGRFVEEYGPKCENVLMHCMLSYDTMDCCEQVRRVTHEKHGTCFLFDRMMQQGTGFVDGFSMLAVFDTLDGHLTQIPDLPITNGLFLEVAYKHEAPRSWHGREQIFIPPDKETRISVEVVHHHKQSSKNHPCNNTATSEPADFSRASCIYGYHNAALEKFCNCSWLGFRENTSSVCNPTQLEHCFRTYLPLMIDYRSSLLEKQGCDPPCYELEFYHRVTSTEIVRSALDRTLNVNGSIDGKNYFLVRVFYQKLSYTEIREFNVLSFDVAVSSLGGILGLYFGASLVSIARAVRKVIAKLWGKTRVPSAVKEIESPV